MILASELINDNGISSIAAAAFTALFTAIAAVIVGVFQIKSKAVEAKDAALETKQEAEQARKNTANIANGFAGSVDRKLDRIIDKQSGLEATLRDHLEWHVQHPPKR